MKIAQIVCAFPPYKGGMGNVANEFSCRLAKRGHQVTVFTPLYSKNPVNHEKQNEKIKIFRLKPLVAYGNAAILSNIKNHLKVFDVIHLHYPFFGTAGLVAKFKKNNPTKKLIITYHMDATGSGLIGLFFKIYAKLIMPKILKAADIITVSSFDYLENSDAKNIFKKYPNKFIELPFGVNLDHFKPAKKDQDLMNKFGIQADDKVLLFVGGLDSAHYFKGLDLLLNAVNVIKECKLVIIGEGNLKSYYQNLVAEKGLREIVKFASSVSYQDLPKYYNLADLFILASINKAEAFGLVLLEAMACGKAVIASDLPGVRTLPVDKERSVFKVGNEDDLIKRIKFLLQEDRLRLSIGEKGREKVEKMYDWNVVVSKLEDMFKIL